ncbi:hypothetical protein [Actinomyces gaoshouyii]|uniref:Aldo/keto reductase n=1 Tax=Actinomyces gaoshouyii TaxID=1960083 RepID=A0A8H9HCD2_9ACTO|nr:hypothetical protein GCM10011612_18210 [Actinomyces gaoshouyii]
MTTALSSPEVSTTTLNNGVATPVIGYGVFLTPPEETERAVREAIEVGCRPIDASLRCLGTDDADLLLVRRPLGDYYGTYRAMEAALGASKARTIGVSNFFPDRFADLVQNVDSDWGPH